MIGVINVIFIIIYLLINFNIYIFYLIIFSNKKELK